MLLAVLLLATSGSALAADKDINADHKPMMAKKKLMMRKKELGSAASIHDTSTCSPDGIALAGIDVVSYHNPTGPLVGNANYTTEYNGLTYRFLSQAHLDEFLEAPETYLPSYQGWCATSLSFGALTCPNPLNYKIEDGQLLLFETTGFTNGQTLWNADPLDYRRRADQNRQRFLSEPSAPTIPVS